MNAVMNDARLERTDDHRYLLGDRELPGVTAILQDVGLADFSAPWFTEDVKTRGQLVHAAIALDIEGDLDDETLDPVLVPYVSAWRQFLADTSSVVEHSERFVCDPAVGYAGTLDAIVRSSEANGRVRRTVLDFKPALYPSVGPQVAAYARCASALYDEPTVLHRAALVLTPNGQYRLHPLMERADEMLFIAALRIFQFRQQHGLSKGRAA